jgi:hypothetical protein
MASEAIKDLIEAVIRERLSSAAIHKVVVTSDEDADGDAVLRVAVILEGKHSDLDRDKVVGLIRHLRSKLGDSEDHAAAHAFPILSFMSKNEAKSLRLETV